MTDIINLLTEDEWELLCDCCALCCLFKLQDEDTDEVFYTSIMCPLLNKETSRCSAYAQRFDKMPSCMKISPESLPKMARWLPKSCAYRCLFERIALPDWHPLFKDESPEAQILKEKIAPVCVRPNTCISKATVDRIIRASKTPPSPRKLTRLLLKNVIEDIDI